MNKFTYTVLNIITFGLYGHNLKKKAQKISQEKNTDLSYAKKYNFNIADLINDLGGKDNIKSVSSTLSTAKFELVDINNVNSKLKEKYKINGISKNANSLILIFGNNSIAIVNDAKQLLNK